MRDFINSERAGMHLMFEVTDGNGRAAQWLYQESFPNRHMSNRKMFPLLHRQLSENGTLIVSIDERGRSKTERQPYIEETNLKLVEETFQTSTTTAMSYTYESTHRLENFKQRTFTPIQYSVSKLCKRMFTLCARYSANSCCSRMRYRSCAIDS